MHLKTRKGCPGYYTGDFMFTTLISCTLNLATIARIEWIYFEGELSGADVYYPSNAPKLRLQREDATVLHRAVTQPKPQPIQKK